MKAAIVRAAGQTPIYGDIAEPVPAAGENRITVSAAAISHLTKGRASGQHYSASNIYPFVAGIDGTGRLDDGTRVYFVLPNAPNGSMADVTVAPAARCLDLPDGLDDVTAAAIANPGMSAWAAFAERARLQPGETVLVNGATGISGRLSIQIAKYFGAGKIIATGRNPEALATLAALGADVTICLAQDDTALKRRFEEEFSQGIDVVADYLWGSSAEKLLAAGAKAGPAARPIRYVQIGAMTGPDIALPGAVLRSSAIHLMGSGIGSVPLDRLLHSIKCVMEAALPGNFKIATKPFPLADLEKAWPIEDSTYRTVLTMQQA